MNLEERNFLMKFGNGKITQKKKLPHRLKDLDALQTGINIDLPQMMVAMKRL